MLASKVKVWLLFRKPAYSNVVQRQVRQTFRDIILQITKVDFIQLKSILERDAGGGKLTLEDVEQRWTNYLLNLKLAHEFCLSQIIKKEKREQDKSAIFFGFK